MSFSSVLAIDLLMAKRKAARLACDFAGVCWLTLELNALGVIVTDHGPGHHRWRFSRLPR